MSATHTVDIAVKLPQDPDTLVSFCVVKTFTTTANEVIKAGEKFEVTTDPNGVATLAGLPVTDNVGDSNSVPAIYNVESGTKFVARVYVVYSASTIELATLVAAGQTNKSADVITTALASYLPLTGGTLSGLLTADNTGVIVPDEILADMTIPADYHMIRHNLKIASGVTVAVDGDLIVI